MPRSLVSCILWASDSLSGMLKSILIYLSKLKIRLLANFTCASTKFDFLIPSKTFYTEFNFYFVHIYIYDRKSIAIVSQSLNLINFNI